MALEVNGTRLYAETVGEGTPTLCLHGGPGTDSSGLVRALAPLAQPPGLRLVFYDHRGHGRSRWEPVEHCTQHQLVADIEGVRRALGVDTVHVLGISWGGFLGLMYAARYPRSLRTLIVVGASASGAFMARAEDIHALVPQSELAVFERSGHSPHVEEREAFIERVGSFLGCARATV